MAVDAIGVGAYYIDPQSEIATHPAKAATNLGFAGYGMINPATFGASSVYFGIDLFWHGGWEGAMQTNDWLIRKNQEVVGPDWQLHPRGGGN